MSSLAKGAKQTAKGPSKLVLKLPAGWAEKQDQAGRTYYWNSETGESQWFPPPMAAKSADTVRTLIIQHNFKAADKDGSGTISKSELGLMLRRITPEMSLKEVEEMHKSMDADMDGKVSFAEFNTWLLSDKQKQLAARLTKNVSSPASAVSATFRIWDTDDSGKLTRAEITSVLQKAIPHITEECLQNIFSELDTDRSGSIDLNEFIAFLYGSDGAKASLEKAAVARRPGWEEVPDTLAARAVHATPTAPSLEERTPPVPVK